MRLTCPRCGAQYEIASAAIPVAGREVECSACSHVWFQPGQPKAAGPYDPGARPALNRPLHESILSILREETARELQARQGAGDKAETPPDQVADQNIANTAPEGGLAAEPALAPPPITPPPITPAPITPAPVVIAPAEAAPIGTQGAKIPDGDWLATTLTSMPAGQSAGQSIGQTAGSPIPAPEEPMAPEAAAQEPDESAPAIVVPAIVVPVTEAAIEAAATIAAAPVEPPAPQPPEVQDIDAKRHEPVIAALPDAAELAATLTRSGPVPAGPARTEPAPIADTAQDKQQDTIPAPAAVIAAAPAVAAARRGSGYASGFGLAAMLALGVVAVYTLAPRIPANEDGGVLAELRQDIDRGRLWLHDRIIGE